MSNYEAVFFDLDGTFVDTAPDLAYALNILLKENGKPSLPYTQIRPIASHGTEALLQLGFGITREDHQFESLKQRYLDIYLQNIARHSILFEGMQEVISQLENQNTSWGIITNKPAFLTEPLLVNLALAHRAVCIVSGDTTPFSKPHPAPMLHACKLANVNADRCLYIGDAERDIQAGRQVNMTTIIAKYGYLNDQDKPELWQADGLINHPRELLTWI